MPLLLEAIFLEEISVHQNHVRWTFPPLPFSPDTPGIQWNKRKPRGGQGHLLFRPQTTPLSIAITTSIAHNLNSHRRGSVRRLIGSNFFQTASEGEVDLPLTNLNDHVARWPSSHQQVAWSISTRCWTSFHEVDAKRETLRPSLG